MADTYEDDVSGVPGPLEAMDDERKLMERIQRHYREARQHTANWRQDAREDYDFVAGEQWSEDDRQLLRDQVRPEVTFNRIGPVVDVVCGTEVQNRQEVRYIPREQGDVQVSEILTGAADWVRDNCDAEDEESDAFLDMVVCGMGWTETRLDYERDEDGQVLIDRTDPMEMYWDPAAAKRNLSDASWIMRVRDMDKDEVRDLWPDKFEELSAAKQLWGDDETDDSPHVSIAGDQYSSGQNDEGSQRKRELRVIEYQWWEREEFYRVADPATNKAMSLDKKQYRVLKMRFAVFGVPLQAVRQVRRVYRRAFVAGSTLLEQGDSPYDRGFTYKCMTGKRDRNTNTWYGLVRAMKDPQRWANKWLSQTMHIMNSNAKGGLLAERGAFENPRKAVEDWAKPDSVTIVKDGALSNRRIQEKSMAQFPAGMQGMMEFAVSSIRDVTGVNIEMLGMAEGNQPGVLDYQRKQAGITILGSMFDSLRRYRKEQGRVLLHFIQEYLSDGRLIRVVGDESERYVPLMREQGVATYDVIVDDAPSSPNQREQTFAVLSQMLPSLLQAGIPIPPEIVEYAPLPSSLTSRWKEMLSNGKGPSPEELAAMRAEFERVKAENAEMKADRQMKMLEQQQDHALKSQDMAFEHGMEREKQAFEFDMARAKHQLDLWEAQQDVAVDRYKASQHANSAARR